ncbi:hypothetical protein, partial [Holdemania massiliensis]
SISISSRIFSSYFYNTKTAPGVESNELPAPEAVIFECKEKKEQNSFLINRFSAEPSVFLKHGRKYGFAVAYHQPSL